VSRPLGGRRPHPTAASRRPAAGGGPFQVVLKLDSARKKYNIDLASRTSTPALPPPAPPLAILLPFTLSAMSPAVFFFLGMMALRGTKKEAAARRRKRARRIASCGGEKKRSVKRCMGYARPEPPVATLGFVGTYFRVCRRVA